MEKLPDDELISAYLDGELSETEHAEVEAWVAGDPSARQTLEDLRAVRAAVHGLPRVQVGEDLAVRVLQLAERRILTETPAGDNAPTPPELRWSAPLRRMLSRRALVWSGLAIAITLVILVTERQQPPGRINPQPAPGQQALIEIPRIGPQSEPPVLRPMPESIARDERRKGGIRAAAPGLGPQGSQEAILVVKCFVRAEAAGDNPLDTLLARQRIVREETPRLMQRAREQAGARIEQSPPPGWVAAGEPKLIYVEATWSQIDSLVQALLARPNEFPQVVVEPGQKGQPGQKQPALLVVRTVQPAAAK